MGNSAVSRRLAAPFSLLGLLFLLAGRKKRQVRQAQVCSLISTVHEVDPNDDAFRQGGYHGTENCLVSFTSQVDKSGHTQFGDEFFGRLSDEMNAQFPVSVQTQVEVCQWVERKEKKEEEGGVQVVSYSYDLEWC